MAKPRKPIRYEVVVGNIGRVYNGTNREDARSTFNVYVEHSKTGYGRAAGESVYLMANDALYLEYVGALEQAEMPEDAS